MENLITFYQHRLNLQNTTFSLIDHEDASVAIVYRITQSNGMHFILKICQRSNDYLREVYFLKYFSGKLPVPHIEKLAEPEANNHGAILMECLPGKHLKITDFTDALAFQTGSVLANIHLNRLAGYGDLIQPQYLTSDPRIHYTLKFEEGLAECSDHLSKKLIERCRRYFETHVNLLASVDGPCIVHRDFRPGNMMVHDGKLQGIIDWASARASFSEEDFCCMEHREWATDAISKESFLEGYASIRPVPDYEEMLPLLRLNRAIAAIGFTVKRGTWNSNNADLYEFNRHFLEAFFK